MPLPHHVPPPSSSSSDPPSSIKSLTPQRKHRKLLKDGSGAEVWPESIEKIFVQGLREYWNSPYATYPQSRGRSRWRNQFLVDFLQKHNITRSKKQVASHIQVLRNMWKGEPEYQLVAGGEEAADMSPPAGSPIKLEEQWANGLIPIDFEDTDGYSSNSTSPDFSPPDFQNQFLPSPDHPATRQLDMGSGVHYVSGPHALVPSTSPYTASFSNTPHDYPTFPGPYDKYGHLSPLRTLSAENNTSVSGYPKPQQYSNRIHALRLTADGMSPFFIRTDALISPNMPYEPLQLKIRLSISTMEDINCSPALHGFLAGICLSHMWTSSGKCITKTIINGTTFSEDIGALEVSDVSVGTVNAALPESDLNRCRWLDSRTPTSITQEIIIDDVSLLFVIYELERTTGNPMPSAHFVGFLKYPASRNGLGSGSSGSIATSSSTRPLSLSPPSTTNTVNPTGSTVGRGFAPMASSAPSQTSSLGFNATANPMYPYQLHHQSGSFPHHSSAMTTSSSGTNGSINPGCLNAYSLPAHSAHTRYPSQTLAHALTPVRYPMATSLPS